jgi:hypothetical protein
VRTVSRTSQHHVVNWSGGIGSWYTARLLREKYGPESITLLFADTLIEADDLYLFSEMAATQLGLNVTVLRDGRTIWDVFEDVRYLGNTRIDPCSYHLKRKLIREWIEKNCDLHATTVYLGIDWSESHRMDKARPYWAPWRVRAPLTSPPFIDKEVMLQTARDDGLAIPSLYTDGFPHNNCGGGCVKAGMGQFKLLLEKRPATYAKWEEGEERVRRHLGKNVAILRDRTGGKTRPLTLREFRERIQAKTIVVDEFDIGGCACAVGDKDEDARVVALGMPGRRPS